MHTNKGQLLERHLHLLGDSPESLAGRRDNLGAELQLLLHHGDQIPEDVHLCYINYNHIITIYNYHEYEINRSYVEVVALNSLVHYLLFRTLVIFRTVSRAWEHESK